MATRYLSRSLLISTRQSLLASFPRSYTAASSAVVPNSSSFLFRIRPLVAALSSSYFGRLLASTRGFATRPTTSSLNDPNPNWSNRPPKETILLDGCDFEHWLVVMEKPEGDPTRDEIIDSYIKTLAQVVGSEEEARMKIYSVSTRHYFAFGALISEELSYKMKEIPRVRWVLPDSYLDVKNKDYGGEPFINGQAVPYDPKYHEEWVRNNARANERNRRNDRPRNFDRSRNFERRREFNNPNSGAGGPGGNMGAPPNMNASPPGAHVGGQGAFRGGAPPNNPGNYPANNPRGGPSTGPTHPPSMGPQSGVPYQSGSAPNSSFNPSAGSVYGSGQNNFSPNQGGPSSGPSHPPSTGPHSGGVPYQSGQAPNSNFNQSIGPGQNYFNPNQGAPQEHHQGSFPRSQGSHPPHGGPVPIYNQNNQGAPQGYHHGNHPPHIGPGPIHNQNNQGQGQFPPQYGNGESSYNPNMGPGPQQNQNAYPPNMGGGNPYNRN